ncbi:MAG: glutathione S-transferase N-terminal domain-containing protein, partial [Oceanospirillaceae bacterium]|nr:glutathione S-transferase N-terminal domain-containing protein [Oceanospirillaceae bacterium]
MIKLYSFGPHFGVADPSPFVLKVDAYLRMAGIEFENISDPNNLSRAPKGKLPFIDDQGELIADSQFIFTHFQDTPQTDLDLHLNEQQKAIAYLTAKSLDENLYFVLVYSRWLRD